MLVWVLVTHGSGLSCSFRCELAGNCVWRGEAAVPPQVRRIELSRIGASGAVNPSLILQLLLECELEGVTRLRCCEGMLPTWDAALFRKLEGLRILNLSGCQLSSLPSGTLHLGHARPVAAC